MSLSDFVILSKIGEGSFSSVHKVNRVSDKKIYALKQVWTFSQAGKNC
jgi:serine/threonine protein kinase